MLALGIAVGAYWHDFFGGFVAPLIAVAVLTLGYIGYIWWKEQALPSVAPHVREGTRVPTSAD